MRELDFLIAEARADRHAHNTANKRIDAAASAIRESALLAAKQALLYEQTGIRPTLDELGWRAYG